MTYSVMEISERPRRGQGGLMRVLGVAGRLVLPVLGLFTVLAVAFFTHDVPVTEDAFAILARFDGVPPEAYAWDPRWWPLTWAYLLVPLGFFAIHLTNRAYGPGLAALQVLVTWSLIGGLVLWVFDAWGDAFTGNPLPPRRMAVSLTLGLVLGQLTACFFFDRTRGRDWWTAPFWGSVFGGLVFVLIVSIGARGLVGLPWAPHLVLGFAYQLAAAIALLVPYYFLRGLIRPAPGFGGR
ncbi:MAG: hypothetical protein HXY25_02920 [Alphaproteobacteria bacterium]|nr:hypothetical protein [Alphaproteobacteria bacterium]